MIVEVAVDVEIGVEVARERIQDAAVTPTRARRRAGETQDGIAEPNEPHVHHRRFTAAAAAPAVNGSPGCSMPPYL